MEIEEKNLRPIDMMLEKFNKIMQKTPRGEKTKWPPRDAQYDLRTSDENTNKIYIS